MSMPSSWYDDQLHLISRRQWVKTGERFGRLEVLGVVFNYRIGKNKNVPRQHVVCGCDCGKITVVAVASLKNGRSTSCGCYRIEQQRKSVRKHGMCSHPLYGVWVCMNQRCGHPNHANYADYGGRGIYVSEDWRHHFMPFYEWAVSNGYEKGLKLDRIDNDGPYAPWNCQFITNRENNRSHKKRKRIKNREVESLTRRIAELESLLERQGVNYG